MRDAASGDVASQKRDSAVESRDASDATGGDVDDPSATDAAHPDVPISDSGSGPSADAAPGDAPSPDTSTGHDTADAAPTQHDAGYTAWSVSGVNGGIDCFAADICVGYFCHGNFTKSCSVTYLKRADSQGARRGGRLQACYHSLCPMRKQSCLRNSRKRGNRCESEFDACQKEPVSNELSCSEILECVLTKCPSGSRSCRRSCRDRGAEGEALEYENYFGCINSKCRDAADPTKCAKNKCKSVIDECFRCHNTN